ncbi:MAG: VWA domain-containing protein [Sandaracinaceae bacterium]
MSDVITLSLEPEHVTLPAGARAKTHLVIRLAGSAEHAVERARPRLRIVFAVDTSGSMEGPPIDHVTRSVAEMLRLLHDDDEVGLVAFSDEAAVVAEVARLGDGHRSTLARRARRLSAGGRTNLEAGVQRGAELLGVRAEQVRHALVVLSDGQPNRGAKTPDGLRALAASLRPDLAISSLGYGARHDEDVLSALADGGAGEYHYVPVPEEAADAFGRVLGAQTDVVADAVELVLRPADGVEIEGFIGRVPMRVSSAGIRASLSDVRAGVTRVVVAALEVDAAVGPGELPLAQVWVRYRVAGASEITTLDASASTERADAARTAQPAHHSVLLARGEVARIEARALADRGSFEGAAATLRAMIAEIEAASGYVANDGSALSEALEQMVDEAVVLERSPSQETYRDAKRNWMAMDLHAGGAHVSDHAYHGASSKALTSRLGPDLPRAVLEGVGGSVRGARFELRGEATLGRSRGNDIPLHTASASKRHARVVPHTDHWVLVDLRSTNQTYVNGRAIERPTRLTPGDRIDVGDAQLIYRERPAAEAPLEEPDPTST